MSDQLLRSFASRAHDLVPHVNFDELVHRGERLRRRRRATVAGVVGALVAITGYALSVPSDQRATGPADGDRGQVEATPYPGGVSLPRLAAGTYELRPSWDPSHPSVVFTVPKRWHGWYGPNRFAGKHGYVGFLALEVDEVVSHPCNALRGGWPVNGAGSLVQTLTRLPGHRLVMAPTPDDRFGYPGTHLRLKAGAIGCPDDREWRLWSDQTGLMQSAGAGSTMDLWVVDVEPKPLLLVATTMPRTPQRVIDELGAVVDSVRLVPGEQ